MTAGAEDTWVFVPLGGAGEIGMNLNLYGYGPPGDRRWIIVDLGVAFGASSSPGVDVVMPDPTFIEERRDRIDGLVLTHAHEDHLGAVPYLWPRLRCPVYGTPFALSVLRRKLVEVGLNGEVPITEVPLGGRFTLGPFDLEFITPTHSIPEPNALAVRTALGTVLHTGDWKLDPDPVVGATADEAALVRLGDEGVRALVCDSTNVFEPGTSGSEGALADTLRDLVAQCPGRVVVTCFASNVARLQTIAGAAAANGRDVVISGRSLKRIEAAARENGYLDDVPAFIDESYANDLPRDRMLLICTGSQGEPRAALWRMANGDHGRVALDPGDTVIFSARVIPGNEASIGRLQNTLIRRGIDVITSRDAAIHVSGHPARDELARMYQLVRPEACIPVHGELRHMTEQARLARSCQVPTAVVAENGTMVRIAPGAVAGEETVPAGRLSLEGNRVVPLNGEVVRERSNAIYNGAALVSVLLNGTGRLLAEPEISTVGLMEQVEEEDVLEQVRSAIRSAIDDLGEAAYRNDAAVREAVRLAVRRKFREQFGKKPLTRVHLMRL